MKIGRRTFAKLSGTMLLALAAIGAPFTMFGCGVFSAIAAWIPVAGAAIDGIVTVLGTFMPPGAALIITAIKAALTSLAGAVNEYQGDTNPADKANALAKIRTFLTDIGNNFQSFLQQLNLGNNPILNIVIGLANVILAAIMGFLGQLPVSVGTRTLSSTYTVGGTSHPVTAKYYRNVKDFRNDYNAVCMQNGHTEIELR
jgi:hypothetical protein